VHCAAKTNLDWCEANPMLALKINVEASAYLSAIASQHGIRVIYVSTDSVFYGNKCWYNESDTVGPINHYARTKFMAESSFHAPKDIIVRCSFYGWNLPDQPPGLFQFFYDQLRSGEYIDGWQDVYFSPLSTFQMADVLLDMMQRGWDGGLYHLGSLWGGSKYEFALELCEIFDLIPRVRRIPYVQSGLVQRPMNITLNTAKLSSKLGRYLFLSDGLNGLKKFFDTDIPQFRSMMR
ncbi:MAG: sugar nucleotide-binding protein, partial [Patescibacteria group bacterium]